MFKAKYHSEKIGALPLHCFQCQQARPFTASTVSLKRGLPGIARTTRYGLVGRCPVCGIAVDLDPDMTACVREDCGSDLAASAREVFGEENAVEHWSKVLGDIDVGLADGETRLNAMASVFNAVGSHYAIPRPIIAPPVRYRRALAALLWICGMGIITATCYFISVNQKSDPNSIIVPVILCGAFYSALIAFLLQYEYSKPNQVQLHRREMERRLAAGLARIQPDGHELVRVRTFAAEQGWWSALPEPHSILFRIDRLKERAPAIAA
jgi:hypothetical protein